MDEENTPDLDLDAIEDMFMKAQPDYVEDEEDKVVKKPVVDPESEDASEDDDAEDDDTEENSDDSDDSDENQASDELPKVSKADDEADVTVTVDGKDLTVKVKDLKRLYGQEASLTQKSQSVATASRAVETQALFIQKLLETRTAAAQAKVAKYSDVDLFKANRELSPEEFDAIRSAQKDAQDELSVLTAENETFMRNAQAHRREILRDRARNSLTEISKSIPDWNDELYTKIRVYAVSQGLDRDDVNEIVDPGAIIMMHKAMKFDAASKKIETVTKKVVKAPTKVVKKSEDRGDYSASKTKQVNRQAANSGDIDDIVDAYLANAKSK